MLVDCVSFVFLMSNEEQNQVIREEALASLEKDKKEYAPPKAQVFREAQLAFLKNPEQEITATSPFDELCKRAERVGYAGLAWLTLEWHQRMDTPLGKDKALDEQIAYLTGLEHKLAIDPEWKDLFTKCEAYLPEGSKELGYVKAWKRVYDSKTKMSGDLVERKAKIIAEAQRAQKEARNKNDFSIFEPHLAAVIEITQEIARARGHSNPYDAMLEEFEPGLTEAKLNDLFALLDAVIEPPDLVQKE